MEKKHLIMGVLILVGILILGVAASADYTGANVTQDDKDTPEFGWVQIVGCLVGGLVVIAGIAVNFIYKDAPKEDEEDEDDDVEEYECPTCGAAVPSDAAECEECGELFEADEDMPDEGMPDTDGPDEEEEPEMGGEEEEDEDPDSEDDDDEEAFECPTCGGEVGDDDAVCPHCGEEFE